jgi:hypothetical protein
VALGAALFARGGAGATDTTAKLMPPGALAYAHLSTADRTQDASLRSIAGRFAVVRNALPRLAAAFTPKAAGLDFETDIRPWLGDDAAVALLEDGTPMLVASVRDRGAAERLLERIGATPAGTYDGVPLKQLQPTATAALARDHLIVGPSTEVRAAIDREAGHGTPSLADARVFRRAADAHSGTASLAVFAGTAGLRRMLDGRGGIAGLAGRLLASPTLEGVDAQFTAEETGVRVDARVLRGPGAALLDLGLGGLGVHAGLVAGLAVADRGIPRAGLDQGLDPGPWRRRRARGGRLRGRRPGADRLGLAVHSGCSRPLGGERGLGVQHAHGLAGGAGRGHGPQGDRAGPPAPGQHAQGVDGELRRGVRPGRPGARVDPGRAGRRRNRVGRSVGRRIDDRDGGLLPLRAGREPVRGGARGPRRGVVGGPEEVGGLRSSGPGTSPVRRARRARYQALSVWAGRYAGNHA